MEIVTFKGKKYPAYQTNGNAARFIMPFAKEICKGVGYDIGCNRPDWSFPDSVMIDPEIDPTYHAHNLPPMVLDYVFSSHCLEHVPDWVRALDHWTTRIKSGGHLFLYLPDYSQEYWRNWNNTKHVNILDPQYIRDYLTAKRNPDHSAYPNLPAYTNIFVSGVDAYNSFCAFAERL